MNLYSTFANEFSQTRENPWKGWFYILPYLKDFILENSKQNSKNSLDLNILDLGCGNGRFWHFLNQQFIKEVSNLDNRETSNKINFNYIGVDNSNILLNIAKKSIKETKESETSFKFLKLDLEKENWNEILENNIVNSKNNNQKFDFIVCFGLMHHIHTFKQRLNLFNQVKSLLNFNGLFIVSFWQFLKLPNFENKVIQKINDFDYILKFGNTKTVELKPSNLPKLFNLENSKTSNLDCHKTSTNATRFCHFYDKNEILELQNQSNFIKIKDFYEDGKNKDLNYYCVFKNASTNLR